jgi:hypothetical protein
MMTALRIAKVIEGSPLTLLEQTLLASEKEKYTVSLLLSTGKDLTVMTEMKESDEAKSVLSAAQCGCRGDKTCDGSCDTSCDLSNGACASEKSQPCMLDSARCTFDRICAQCCKQTKSCNELSVSSDHCHSSCYIQKPDNNCAFTLSNVPSTEHGNMLTDKKDQVFQVDILPDLNFDFHVGALTGGEKCNNTMTSSAHELQQYCDDKSPDSGISLKEFCPVCQCTILEFPSSGAVDVCTCNKIVKSTTMNLETLGMSGSLNIGVFNSEQSSGSGNPPGSLTTCTRQEPILCHDHEISENESSKISQSAALAECGAHDQKSNCEFDEQFGEKLDVEDCIENDSAKICETSKPVLMFPAIYQSNLQALDISYVSLNEKDLTSACLLHLLCRNPNMKQLQLTWKELDDEILENIIADHAKELKWLSLVCTFVDCMSGHVI